MYKRQPQDSILGSPILVAPKDSALGRIVAALTKERLLLVHLTRTRAEVMGEIRMLKIRDDSHKKQKALSEQLGSSRHRTIEVFVVGSVITDKLVAAAYQLEFQSVKKLTRGRKR